MKIHCVPPNENWILDRFKDEFDEYTKCYDNLADNVYEADIVWLLSSYSMNQIPWEVLKNKKTKIVSTIHHVVPSKFMPDQFVKNDEFVDVYHVPCRQTEKFIRKFTNKHIERIPYWVCHDFWCAYDKSKAREELGLEQDRFYVGSFQRDTEGHDTRLPKLEKGPDIFCDYVERLKEQYGNKLCVLLNGYRRQYVIRELKKRDIDFVYNELPSLDIVRKMYAACDLYVVGSRFEGGPQAILECAAMKVPIISNDVGVARDILSSNCVIDVKNGMYFPTEEDLEISYNNVMNYRMDIHGDVFLEYFEKVMNGEYSK